MPKRPKKPCKHFGEYGYSSLNGRYAYWCKVDPLGDICMEDMRCKKADCENYEPDERADEFSLSGDPNKDTKAYVKRLTAKRRQ